MCDQGDEEIEKWVDTFNDLNWVLKLLLKLNRDDDAEDEAIPVKHPCSVADSFPLSKRYVTNKNVFWLITKISLLDCVLLLKLDIVPPAI